MQRVQIQMLFEYETAKKLTDFERKLITIVQHESRKGQSPALEALKKWTGREEDEIKETIKDLVQRRWLAVYDKKLIVSRKLF